MVTTEREVREKEITEKGRFVRITKKNCEIVISSPSTSDRLKTLIKEADRLATKHSRDNERDNMVG